MRAVVRDTTSAMNHVDGQFDHRSDEDGVDHGILPGSRQRREMRARLMCDGQRSTRDARAARLWEGSMRSSPAHMRRRTRSSPPRRALSGSDSERHEGPLLLGSGRCSVTTASARKVLILGWNETSLVGPSYARASAALNCRWRILSVCQTLRMRLKLTYGQKGCWAQHPFCP